MLDGSLGFSSGVMLAASYWSLLAPAIELSALDSTYGKNGEFAFIPAFVGVLFGAFFVYLSDVFISSYEMDVLNILIPGKLWKLNDKFVIFGITSTGYKLNTFYNCS